MSEKKIDGVIFDLDGTMWNATETLVGAWNEVFREEGIDKVLSREDLQGVMGLIIEEIGECFAPDMDPDARTKLMKKCCQRETVYLRSKGGCLYDGLETTLAELSKTYRLFIVSNCEEGYIQSFFYAHGLEKYFRDIEYIGRSGLSKGENIRLIARRNGLKHPVYVGDTQKDLEASRAADVPFIYAAYGFGEAEGYDGKIEAITELPHVLKNM